MGGLKKTKKYENVLQKSQISGGNNLGFYSQVQVLLAIPPSMMLSLFLLKFEIEKWSKFSLE